MEPEQINRILNLLGTIGEGLAYLQTHEDASVRQAVADGRQAATRELEAELGETLDCQINASALSDAEWGWPTESWSSWPTRSGRKTPSTGIF